jgi:MHS family proline/betaine transporter-like MFS transporter
MKSSDVATSPPPVATNAVRRRAAFLATLGNVLEWYDFTVYGFLAAYIAATFFPSDDPIASLLAAFAVFAVGFIARPLGSFILGPLVDRKGRKSVMLVSMMVMATGSLLIGVAPGYLAAGATGAAMVVIGRLLQGFSAGGEFGSSAVFLVEWAGPGRRGLFGSFHQIATYGGLIFGVLLVAALTAIIGPEAMAAWGWRIPFLIGAVLAVVVLILRRRITDTPVFLEHGDVELTPHTRAPERGMPGVVRAFLLTVGVVAMWGVTSMVSINYMPTFAANFAGIAPQSALWAVFAGGVVAVGLIPVFGSLSDRFGRKWFVVGAAAAFVVLPYPLFTLVVETRQFWALLVVQLIFAIPTAATAGVGTSTIVELFPTRVRGTMVSIATALAVTVFGGFGGYICTWLIQTSGVVVAPAFYIMAVAVLVVVAGALLPDLARRPLRP